MKEKLIFIGKFLLFSTLLFALWIIIGRYYLLFLAHLATPFLHLMGYDVTLVVNEQIIFTYMGAEIGLAHAELTNYNIIPFIALILATPLTLRRMGKNLLIGLPVIVLFHLINLIAHFPFYFDQNMLAGFIMTFSGITRMLIPFLLWFALCYDYVLKSFRRIKKRYRCPICGKHTAGIMMHIKDVHPDPSKNEKQKINRLISNYPELTTGDEKAKD